MTHVQQCNIKELPPSQARYDLESYNRSTTTKHIYILGLVVSWIIGIGAAIGDARICLGCA